MTSPEMAGAAALLLRVAMGIMFLAHGWLKIRVFTPAGTVKYFESLGLPGFFAYLTIVGVMKMTSSVRRLLSNTPRKA